MAELCKCCSCVSRMHNAPWRVAIEWINLTWILSSLSWVRVHNDVRCVESGYCVCWNIVSSWRNCSPLKLVLHTQSPTSTIDCLSQQHIWPFVLASLYLCQKALKEILFEKLFMLKNDSQTWFGMYFHFISFIYSSLILTYFKILYSLRFDRV